MKAFLKWSMRRLPETSRQTGCYTSPRYSKDDKPGLRKNTDVCQQQKRLADERMVRFVADHGMLGVQDGRRLCRKCPVYMYKTGSMGFRRKEMGGEIKITRRSMNMVEFIIYGRSSCMNGIAGKYMSDPWLCLR